MPETENDNTAQERKEITWWAQYYHQASKTSDSATNNSESAFKFFAGESPNNFRTFTALIPATIAGAATLFGLPFVVAPLTSTINYFSRTSPKESDIKKAQTFFRGDLDTTDKNKMSIFTTLISFMDKSTDKPKSDASKALKDKINFYINNPTEVIEIDVNKRLKVLFTAFKSYIGDINNRGKNLYNTTVNMIAAQIEADEKDHLNNTLNRII